MTGRRTRYRAGDFVGFPLPSGGWGYGRVLPKLMAFYGLRTTHLASVDDVCGSSILFRVAVRVPAISQDRWPIIGHRPLELELQDDVKFFRRNPSGAGFLVYVSRTQPRNAYQEREASVEECMGLEPLLVWEPAQMEQRVDDHFQHRENVHLTHYMGELKTRDTRVLN